jgi:outer membrane protein OmpA-like peptidoglycan-associated protein
MAAPHPSIPLALLALGFADVLYLNLAAAPAYVAERARAARAAEPLAAGAAAPAEPTLAAEPILADPTRAAEPILADPTRAEPTRAEPIPADPTRAEPTPAEPIPAAGPLAPTAGEAGAAATPEARPRALDPQLATQTGAELEPERRAARALDRETLGHDLPEPDVTVPVEDAHPPLRIQFGESDIDLDDGARARLDRVARSLAAGRSRRALIEGHSDGHGRLAQNEQLSRRRAEKVAAYLESRGVDRSRMTVRSFGQRRPLDRGAGAEADRRNRRVDVRVTGAGSGVEE